MDTVMLTIAWILVVGAVVAVVAWLGPRPSQWRAHSEVPGSTEDDSETTNERS
jgi:hypothetical protein